MYFYSQLHYACLKIYRFQRNPFSQAFQFEILLIFYVSDVALVLLSFYSMILFWNFCCNLVTGKFGNVTANEVANPENVVKPKFWCRIMKVITTWRGKIQIPCICQQKAPTFWTFVLLQLIICTCVCLCLDWQERNNPFLYIIVVNVALVREANWCCLQCPCHSDKDPNTFSTKNAQTST